MFYMEIIRKKIMSIENKSIRKNVIISKPISKITQKYGNKFKLMKIGGFESLHLFGVR